MSWSFTEPKRPGVYWLMDVYGSYVARKTEKLGWVPESGEGCVFKCPVIMYGPRIPEPRPPTPKQQGEMMKRYQQATGWKPKGLNTKKGRKHG